MSTHKTLTETDGTKKLDIEIVSKLSYAQNKICGTKTETKNTRDCEAQELFLCVIDTKTSCGNEKELGTKPT